MRRYLLLILLTMALSTVLVAQSENNPPVELQPDLVVLNAKIVTMDDPGFGPEVGTIHEAMAVSGDRIVATGSNEEIRKLAGAASRVIDLEGRTVLPSFILTHEHPTDWMWIEPEAVSELLQIFFKQVMSRIVAAPTVTQ